MQHHPDGRKSTRKTARHRTFSFLSFCLFDGLNEDGKNLQRIVGLEEEQQEKLVGRSFLILSFCDLFDHWFSLLLFYLKTRKFRKNVIRFVDGKFFAKRNDWNKSSRVDGRTSNENLFEQMSSNNLQPTTSSTRLFFCFGLFHPRNHWHRHRFRQSSSSNHSQRSTSSFTNTNWNVLFLLHDYVSRIKVEVNAFIILSNKVMQTFRRNSENLFIYKM